MSALYINNVVVENKQHANVTSVNNNAIYILS